MFSKWQYNLMVGLGVLAVLLVITNGVLFTQNRGLQAGLNQRQQFVQQTVQLQGLYNDIVKTLAQMAVKGNDRDVLNMLAAQGLTVTVNTPAATGGTTPTAGTAPASKGNP